MNDTNQAYVDLPRNKQEIVDEWYTLLKHEDTIILDTETTGLSQQSEIIELGIINVSGDTIFQQYYMPSVPIDQDSIEIHGLSEKKLEKLDAIDWSDKHAEVSDILANAYKVVIFNSSYDTRLLRVTAGHRNLELPHYAPYCAMKSYAYYLRPERRYVKLAEAANNEGVINNSAHEAVADCQTVLSVMKSMVARHM